MKMKWKTCLEQVQGFEGLAAGATLNRSFPWVLPSASTDSFVICLVINFQHWQLNENQRDEFFFISKYWLQGFRISSSWKHNQNCSLQ